MRGQRPQVADEGEQLGIVGEVRHRGRSYEEPERLTDVVTYARGETA